MQALKDQINAQIKSLEETFGMITAPEEYLEYPTTCPHCQREFVDGELDSGICPICEEDIEVEKSEDDIQEEGYERLTDDILDIKYERSLGSDGVNEITLTLCTGGPHVEIQLYNGKTTGWWGDIMWYEYADKDMVDWLWDYYEDMIPTGGC